jgi:hypothetical protein
VNGEICKQEKKSRKKFLKIKKNSTKVVLLNLSLLIMLKKMKISLGSAILILCFLSNSVSGSNGFDLKTLRELYKNEILIDAEVQACLTGIRKNMEQLVDILQEFLEEEAADEVSPGGGTEGDEILVKAREVRRLIAAARAPRGSGDNPPGL